MILLNILPSYLALLVGISDGYRNTPCRFMGIENRTLAPDVTAG
jgi:hypothetical protein